MPGLDLGSAINGAAAWVSDAPIIRGIVSNPVYTALLITALVVVVAMGLYGRQIRQAGAKRAVRGGIYLLLLVTAVTFVHHYAVSRHAHEAAAQKGVRDVFTGIQQSRAAGASAPIWGAAPAAVAFGGGPAHHAQLGPRPDNVALDSEITIEDVIIPSAPGQHAVR